MPACLCWKQKHLTPPFVKPSVFNNSQLSCWKHDAVVYLLKQQQHCKMRVHTAEMSGNQRQQEVHSLVDTIERSMMHDNMAHTAG